MPDRLEELSAVWIATIVEGAAVLAFLAAFAVWVGIASRAI